MSFGGSLENRARILMMALDAVRAGVGPGFPIEVRLSGDDLTPTGLGLEDCIEVAKLIQDRWICLIFLVETMKIRICSAARIHPPSIKEG